MTPAILVRPSADADIPEIARIYGHHVLHGLASFEEVAPPAEEMARRRADILSRIPSGRFVELEEIASMVAWICSPEASFSTGAVFDLSGGRATY